MEKKITFAELFELVQKGVFNMEDEVSILLQINEGTGNYIIKSPVVYVDQLGTDNHFLLATKHINCFIEVSDKKRSTNILI